MASSIRETGETAMSSLIRATDETDPSKSGVDIYNLRKFQR